ncbi:delta-sarcoglycan [Drosophila bipectinata]|uniref:delta-sarcoglycan n=1 Tax=Drosophila bipectinata TaxID=42026 RepID=UPI001C8ABCBC|nr:delta-sarcoglycan [Drosophila bipectinata]
MLAGGSGGESSNFGSNTISTRQGTTSKRPPKAGKGGMTASSSNSARTCPGGSKGGNNTTASGTSTSGGAMTTVTAATTTGKATVSHGHGRHRSGRSGTATGSGTGTGTGNGSGTNNGSGSARCNVDGFVGGIETYLGLIGWRKKCLYTLLLLLMLLIITNLVLTLWILKVMEFSTEGMGQLKIVPGGIQLSGQAIIMDMLRASTIRSRHGQPLSIESSRNFSINTRDPNGMIENHLFLGHDKFECLSSGFRINDTNGRSLFSVNRDEVTIGAHSLRIDGEGGAVFRESVQTPHIRAEPGRELRLESPTRQLEMTAAKDINLQSRAGGIEVVSLEDVKFRALDGSLRLESSKILMPNLRTAQPPIMGTAQSRDHMHRVFQLCACSSGKLFLAAPHSICAGDDSTVCR